MQNSILTIWTVTAWKHYISKSPFLRDKLNNSFLRYKKTGIETVAAISDQPARA